MKNTQKEKSIDASFSVDGKNNYTLKVNKNIFRNIKNSKRKLILFISAKNINNIYILLLLK